MKGRYASISMRVSFRGRTAGGSARGVVPVVGDWDGDGMDTHGLYQNGIWFLRNANTTGVADITFSYGGAPNMTPVASDWNG